MTVLVARYVRLYVQRTYLSKTDDYFVSFVICLIDSPSFASQTNEFLTLEPKFFGSSFEHRQTKNPREIRTAFSAFEHDLHRNGSNQKNLQSRIRKYVRKRKD